MSRDCFVLHKAGEYFHDQNIVPRVVLLTVFVSRHGATGGIEEYFMSHHLLCNFSIVRVRSCSTVKTCATCGIIYCFYVKTWCHGWYCKKFYQPSYALLYFQGQGEELLYIQNLVPRVVFFTVSLSRHGATHGIVIKIMPTSFETSIQILYIAYK